MSPNTDTPAADDLQLQIEAAFQAVPQTPPSQEAIEAFQALIQGLQGGLLRAAEPDPASPTGWRVNAWVKQGILLGFRLGALEGMTTGQTAEAVFASRSGPVFPNSSGSAFPSNAGPAFSSASSSAFPYVDKNTYPARQWTVADGVRIVPGGSSVRTGAYLAPGVVCMPPMYVNVGAYVDAGTMVDSHALVGSCAQIGKRVHLSAAAQIGGVLEPVNASPVILEDEVLVGGNCGVYEGTIVRRGAVLAAGTVLTRGTPVYDVVRGEVYRATAETPLIIPENAVVVPGARSITKGKAAEWGLSVATPIIVKYRDDKTELSLALEELLR